MTSATATKRLVFERDQRGVCFNFQLNSKCDLQLILPPENCPTACSNEAATNDGVHCCQIVIITATTRSECANLALGFQIRIQLDSLDSHKYHQVLTLFAAFSALYFCHLYRSLFITILTAIPPWPTIVMTTTNHLHCIQTMKQS